MSLPPIFNLSWKTIVGVLLLVTLLIAGFFFPLAHADSPLDAPYVQISGGAAFVRGKTEIIDLTFTQPSSALRKAYWQESLTVIGESTYHYKAVPNNYMLRALFVDGFGKFDVGLGVAWVDNYLPYNGQHLNFALQLAYRLPFGMTATYAHVSDAGTKLPNLGRDMLLLGWRFH